MEEWNCFLCKEFQSGTACTFCDDGSEFRKMTNADRIRSMTDEELAEFIDSGCPDCARICPDFKAGCSWTCQHHQGKDFLLKWLQSEAE